MKLLVYILLFLSCCAYGQHEKNGDVILFTKGTTTYNVAGNHFNIEYLLSGLDTTKSNERNISININHAYKSILNESLEYFKEIIEKYPKSKLYTLAIYNTAQVNFELENNNEAKQYFTKVLASKAKDNDLSDIGRGIMAEPYVNYKNKACKRLAEIAYRESDYNTAIEYLKLTKKYPYQHFCGNAHEADDLYMAISYAKIYIAMGNRKEALACMLPYITDNDFVNNDVLVNLAFKTIVEEYGVDTSRTIYNMMVDSLYTKDIMFNKKKYPSFIINYESKEIILSPPMDIYSLNPESQVKELAVHLRNSKFNKMLNE